MQETSIATNDSILLCTLTSLLITYFYNIHVLKNLFLSIFNFSDFPENFLIRTPQILFHRCASYVGFAITSMYNSKKKKKSASEKRPPRGFSGRRFPMKEPLATVVEITRPFSAPINYIRRWCAPFCRFRLANRGDKRAATITLKQHLTSLSGRPDESSHAFHSFDYPPIQPSHPSIPPPSLFA